MGFIATKVSSYLTEDYSPMAIFVNDVLIRSPREIQEKFIEQFKKHDIRLIMLNERKDICLDFNRKINFGDKHLVELFNEAWKFMHGFCISNVGYIDEIPLRFPNEHYPIKGGLIVPFAESDRHNKIMICVDSKDIEASDKMSIEIKFRSKKYDQETEETLHPIIYQWVNKMNKTGIMNEYIKTSLSDLTIIKTKSGVKFNITSTPLIKYPLFDLYLRLRSNFDKFSRPYVIVFGNPI